MFNPSNSSFFSQKINNSNLSDIINNQNMIINGLFHSNNFISQSEYDKILESKLKKIEPEIKKNLCTDIYNSNLLNEINLIKERTPNILFNVKKLEKYQGRYLYSNDILSKIFNNMISYEEKLKELDKLINKIQQNLMNYKEELDMINHLNLADINKLTEETTNVLENEIIIYIITKLKIDIKNMNYNYKDILHLIQNISVEIKYYLNNKNSEIKDELKYKKNVKNILELIKEIADKLNFINKNKDNTDVEKNNQIIKEKQNIPYYNFDNLDNNPIKNEEKTKKISSTNEFINRCIRRKKRYLNKI